MARPRKLVEEQTCHLTKEEKERKEYEQDLLSSASKEQLQKSHNKELINSVAKKEFKRIVEELDKIGMIGNIDLSLLVGYANAYSLYLEATAELKDQPLVITTLANGYEVKKENPLLKIQRDYAKEFRAFADKLGISIQSRLTVASKIVDQQEQQIEDTFGDI